MEELEEEKKEVERLQDIIDDDIAELRKDVDKVNIKQYVDNILHAI